MQSSKKMKFKEDMTENIDHDRLFKELISTFFIEFIELFFPQVLEYIDTESIIFLEDV